MVVVAVKGHGLIGPQHADQPHRFPQAGETLAVVGPLDAERTFVEVLARAHAKDHSLGVERAERSERLGDDRGVIAKSGRYDRRPKQDSLRTLAGRGQPCERKWRVAVGVAPGLKVIADENRVEAVRLRGYRKVEQLTGSELLGRGFVTKLQLGPQSVAPAVALPAKGGTADRGRDDHHHKRDQAVAVEVGDARRG